VHQLVKNFDNSVGDITDEDTCDLWGSVTVLALDVSAYWNSVWHKVYGFLMEILGDYKNYVRINDKMCSLPSAVEVSVT
jgi:hypothetical protein